MKVPHVLYGKKLLPLPILVLLVLSLLSLLSVNVKEVSAVEPPAIYIDPATTVKPLTPGNNYTISIKTNYTGDDIWSWEFALTYNPNVLNGGVKKTDTWFGVPTNTDTWIVDRKTQIFNTTGTPVVPDSEKVYVNETLMTKPANYTILYPEGKILFPTAPGLGANVTATYQYLTYGTTGTPVVKNSEEVYVNETLMTRITRRTDVWTSDGVTRTFYTAQPVFPDTETVLVDGMPPSWWGLHYTIDYSTGNITFNKAPDRSAKIKVAYDIWGDYTINYEGGNITLITPPGEVEIKATYLYGGITNGDLVTKDKDSSALFIPGSFDNTIGELSKPGAVFLDFDPPQYTTSGPGTLANVTFTVVGKGISDITIGDETNLLGYTEGGAGESYSIIDAKTMPEHIQHGKFDNRFPHDVAVGSVTAPAKAAIGSLVPVGVDVVNIGASEEDVEVAVSYDGVLIETKQVHLLVGESEPVTLTCNTTGLTEARVYTINATATIEDDGDPTDNWNITTILLSLHNVAMVGLTAPDKAVIGEPIPINVTVANIGASAEVTNVTISYDTTVIDSQNVTLVKGESKTVLFSWNTTGVAQGIYTINATATLPVEDDPSDNWNTTTILLALHNVAIANILTPSTAYVGENVTIRVLVANKGGYNETFDVEVTYDSNVIGRQAVTLLSGRSDYISFPWNTTGVAPASYYLTAEAFLDGDADLDDNRWTQLYPIVVKLPLGTIVGTVADASTGSPIAGANVTANDYTNTTDAEGHYSIQLPPETYTVTASATKYVDQSETATVTADTTTTLDFELTPLNGTISGTVTDSSTDDPIAGAKVTTNGISVSTGADGSYSIELAPGTYTVEASADGYESASQSDVTVVAGKTTTMDFELTPTPAPPSGIPWYLYVAAAGVAAIITAAIAFYFLRIRKPKLT
ncbi:MAG: carboxypeptidase regulatory-like domain-containing protein [Candidatus Bathyarchaeota archaeon]|nr:carboxypeptidase regulatory-like domain-containing protein [Candidatus Bathyarchaeota archaeon]